MDGVSKGLLDLEQITTVAGGLVGYLREQGYSNYEILAIFRSAAGTVESVINTENMLLAVTAVLSKR